MGEIDDQDVMYGEIEDPNVRNMRDRWPECNIWGEIYWER